MKRIVYLTFIFLLSLYCLDLYFNNDLNKYINPRYIGLTFGAAIVGVCLSSVGLFLRRKKIIELFTEKHRTVIIGVIIVALCLLLKLYIIALGSFIFLLFTTDLAKSVQKNVGDVLLVLVISLGFLLPTVQLQSITAETRLDNLNAFQINSDQTASNIQFIFNTDDYTISDWITTINTNPNLESLESKNVNVIGFIFKPKELDAEYFLVGRFVVRCCAVDAIPAGLYAKADLNEFTEDDWVRVKGVFDVGEINGVKQVFITNVEMEKVDMPKDPYIYI